MATLNSAQYISKLEGREGFQQKVQ